MNTAYPELYIANFFLMQDDYFDIPAMYYVRWYPLLDTE